MNCKIIVGAAVVIMLGMGAQGYALSVITTDGMTYNNITKKRVDADGLYIEYTPAGGGMGVAKVKFARLSKELQEFYGFNAAKAQDYEDQQAQAAGQWAADTERMQREARERRYAAEVECAQAQALRNQEMLAQAQAQEQQEYHGSTVSTYSWSDVQMLGIPMANLAQGPKPPAPGTSSLALYGSGNGHHH